VCVVAKGGNKMTGAMIILGSKQIFVNGDGGPEHQLERIRTMIQEYTVGQLKQIEAKMVEVENPDQEVQTLLDNVGTEILRCTVDPETQLALPVIPYCEGVFTPWLYKLDLDEQAVLVTGYVEEVTKITFEELLAIEDLNSYAHKVRAKLMD
jgi:hypothetical protein